MKPLKELVDELRARADMRQGSSAEEDASRLRVAADIVQMVLQGSPDDATRVIAELRADLERARHRIYFLEKERDARQALVFAEGTRK